MANRYAKMTQQDFDRILNHMVCDNYHTLLSIPGIYEVLAEHWNNEILEAWEDEQEMEAEMRGEDDE
jgi:hypothetical protein